MHVVAFNAAQVRAVAFSPDGKYLATAGNDGWARMIQTDSGKPAGSWGHSSYPEVAVAFSPDSQWLAWGGLSAVVGIVSVEFRPDATDPMPRWFYPALQSSLRTGAMTVSSLAYSPSGQYLYFGMGQRYGRIDHGSIRRWDTDSSTEQVALYVSGGVQHLAVRPDGKQIALGTGHGWRYVDVTTWTIGEVMSLGRTAPALAYSPDGRTLVVSQRKNIYLQKVATGDCIRNLEGHGSTVTSLAFTPDGQSLLSGSWDRTVRVWSPSTGQQKAALDWERGKVQYVAVAPDGMTAAAACDRGVVIWDLD